MPRRNRSGRRQDQITSISSSPTWTRDYSTESTAPRQVRRPGNVSFNFGHQFQQSQRHRTPRTFEASIRDAAGIRKHQERLHPAVIARYHAIKASTKRMQMELEALAANVNELIPADGMEWSWSPGMVVYVPVPHPSAVDQPLDLRTAPRCPSGMRNSFDFGGGNNTSPGHTDCVSSNSQTVPSTGAHTTVSATNASQAFYPSREPVTNTSSASVFSNPTQNDNETTPSSMRTSTHDRLRPSVAPHTNATSSQPTIITLDDQRNPYRLQPRSFHPPSTLSTTSLPSNSNATSDIVLPDAEQQQQQQHQYQHRPNQQQTAPLPPPRPTIINNSSSSNCIDGDDDDDDDDDLGGTSTLYSQNRDRDRDRDLARMAQRVSFRF